MGKSLLSVKKTAEQGNSIVMNEENPRIIDVNGKATKIMTENGVYMLKAAVFFSTAESLGKSAAKKAIAKDDDEKMKLPKMKRWGKKASSDMDVDSMEKGVKTSSQAKYFNTGFARRVR